MTIHYPNAPKASSRCARCNAVLEAGNLFCQNCGTRVQAVTQTQPAAQESGVLWAPVPETIVVHLKNVQTLEEASAGMKSGEMVVGRSEAQSLLTLKGDASISRQQFKLVMKNGMMTLTNISSNGTTLNNSLLEGSQSAAVQQGDYIAMGNSTYVISWHRVRTWRGR